MSEGSKILSDMNDRSREVFRRVVEGYLANGEPVGSRTLTRSMTERLSAATIRNVMQDLELLGLLDSPHISAGRPAPQPEPPVPPIKICHPAPGPPRFGAGLRQWLLPKPHLHPAPRPNPVLH